MTCIVGFTDKKNNTTWIGADSLGSNGYTQEVETNRKVFRNNTLENVVMGSTSTFRHIDLLRYNKNLFPEIDKYKIKNEEVTVNHEYMVTTFIPNIITLFDNGIKSETSCNKGANFLVGVDGKLFEIQNDYSVLEPLDGYSAVGCGELAAKASLCTTVALEKMGVVDFEPYTHIIYALKAAEKNMCGVQRPFVITNTKNKEIFIIDKDDKIEVLNEEKNKNDNKNNKNKNYNNQTKKHNKKKE